MILFPAIDILDGECVRLLRGDYNSVTKYGSPVEMALKWQQAGARYLHIVDLNAAKTGKSENSDCIKEIIDSVQIPVQTGGGVRTFADIESRLQAGVRRVIIGTACCENPETVQYAVKTFGADRIVCSIDVKDGVVATNGWLTQSNKTPLHLGKEMFKMGVQYVVYTDISRDGVLNGVNTVACAEIARQTGLFVIASGGINSLDDITALKKQKMYGAILGKALYMRIFTLEQALMLAEE